MGIKEASIYLDNQWNTYYAGQTVNGRIEYEFDSPKKVRGVYVKFKGEAHTSWHEKETRRDADGKTHDVDTAHTGDEEYFHITYYILGSKTGAEIDIPPGRQTYTFTCTLPPTLPSSFEGEFGYVRYTVKVVLDRPWKFDQETKMAFTVLNPLDLNLNPHYREPIHMQFEKTFCCLCCASAPLAVDVRAPVSGYCAGQTIPIEIDVDNKSNVQLHLVKVYLRKVVTFRATMPKSTTKKTKHVIVETKEGPAPENTIKHWSLKLEIPPLPPSNLVNCSIIDLDYDLKVECVVSGVHMNLSDKKCITIGTVPLMEGALPSPAASNGQPAPAQASYGVPDQPAPYGVPGQPAPYAVPGQPAPYAVPGQPAPYAVPPGQPAPYGVPGQPAVQPSSPAQPYGPSPTPSAPSLPTPPAGGEAPSGWVMPAPAPSPYPHPSGPGPAPGQPLPQSLYPMLDPIFKESMDTARTIQDRNDSEHVRIIGATNFAPRYPTYAAVQPPPLPR